MAAKVDRLNSQRILNSIVSWGTRILFVVAIVVLTVLSFVEKFELTPDLKRISTLALIAAVFNWLVWDSYYRQQYEKVIVEDINNKDYCIHKRYYDARKDWKYKELQDKIREYNEDFKNAWLKDCEDITGRTIEEIENGPYKKQSHKLIIWRIKHKKYPKTGIRTPNDVLYVLSVGKADSMRIHTKAAEHHHSLGRISKAITVLFGCLLMASLAYDFIKGNYISAIVTLVLNIAMLFMSLFFGATSGVKGGQLKLSTAEIVSERLEEWKNQKPSQEPYNEEVVVEEQKTEVKQEKITFDIR